MKLEARIKRLRKALLVEARKHEKSRYAAAEKLDYGNAMEFMNRQAACERFAAMLADLLEEHEQGKRDG